MMELKRLSRTVKYTGKVFDLIVDEIQYPSGNKAIREIAHHPGGAVAVPVFEDGRVILVQQFRHPFESRILELPAGRLGAGEDPSECARRELEEETGWRAEQWERLTSIYTTPGFCDEELHLFLARKLTPAPGGPRREEGELTMTVHILPLDEAVAMVEKGEIKDSKTIAGLLLASRTMGRERR
jgi:ADP-ribose pyrophosphatase